MDEQMPDSQEEGSVKASSVIETTELPDLDELAQDDPNDSSFSFDGTLDGPFREPVQPVPNHQGFFRNSPLLKSATTSSDSDSSARSTPRVLSRPHPLERRMLGVRIPPKRFKPLPYASGRTGAVFDSRMRHHMDQISSDDDAHPERPQRIFEIWSELKQAGLLVEDENGADADADFKLLRIPAREATENELLLVHSREHVDFVRSCERWDLDEVRRRTEVGEGESSIYWHNLTWMCAQLAAGGAIEATRAVAYDVVRNAVAVIRPPGHHAEHDKPGGFCFFDNVAVAARSIQEESKDTKTPIRKILILDWDVHHGNGVQQAFYDNPNVLYISIHVYKGGQFYPHNTYADHLHWGIGTAEGKTVNIPWETQGMRDADYLLAFQQIVMPVAFEFDPDLVMISAGFDAAAGDPLGQCFVSPAGYGHMTHMLMQLAKGKVVACLEGGYNLHSIAISALAMTRTLMGEPPERVGELIPSPSAVTTIQQVIKVQSQFWKCLHPKFKALHNHKDLGSERLHDVIREYQSRNLFENFGMSELKINKRGLSRTYKDQVLATRNFQDKRPLLVIFHDPPEVLGAQDSRTSQLELHNSFLTDGCKTYVEWAVKQEWGVIDVNIPFHYTASATQDAVVTAEKLSTRLADCRDIAKYLWENYIEALDNTHVIFLGIGDAFFGIAELFRSQPAVLRHVDFTIGFIAEHDVRGVQDNDDETVAKHYYRHSLIFVSEEHRTWDPEMRKLRKKHGGVVKSDKSRLQEMLRSHREVVFEKLDQRTAGWRDLASGQDDMDMPSMLDENGHTHDTMDLDELPKPRDIITIDGTADEGFISQVQQPSPVKAGMSTPPLGYFSTTPKKSATPSKT